VAIDPAKDAPLADRRSRGDAPMTNSRSRAFDPIFLVPIVGCFVSGGFLIFWALWSDSPAVLKHGFCRVSDVAAHRILIAL
jgi:hypothetical protein